MHSQYEDENDDQRFLSRLAGGPLMVAAGMGGATLLGRGVRRLERSLYKNFGGSKSVRWEKTGAGFYDQTLKSSSLFTSSNTARDAFLNKNMNGWQPYKKSTGFWKGLKEDLSYFKPGRTRVANEADVIFQKMWGRNLTKGVSRIAKPSMAGAFALMGINSEVDQHGVAGIVTGAAKEVGAFAGYRTGSFIGSKLVGGTGMVSSAGGFVGGALLAMGAYAAVDTVFKISKMGRRWSLPELGGNFHDSTGAITMRQRSLNSIATSQFNLRNELGKEAVALMTGIR